MEEDVCIVIKMDLFKSRVMNAIPSFATNAIGAMSFKPITKFESVIDAMHSTADNAMKWINVMIVQKLYAPRVVHC